MADEQQTQTTNPEGQSAPENQADNVEQTTQDASVASATNAAPEDKEKDLNDKILRLAAELENTRRRGEQQVSELKKYAISDFAKEVIGVLENFYLIMDNAPSEEMAQNEAVNQFFEGVKITHNDLLKVFEKNGIKRIFPLGEKFDHNTQQVVSQVDSDQEAGTVVQVLQAGYILNDRLLKEAMVVVAK